MKQAIDYRYKVVVILDADYTETGETFAYSDDLAEAKAYASGDAGIYGAAIIDTHEGTIDWGHGVSKIGEPAPPFVDPCAA